MKKLQEEERLAPVTGLVSRSTFNLIEEEMGISPGRWSRAGMIAVLIEEALVARGRDVNAKL